MIEGIPIAAGLALAVAATMVSVSGTSHANDQAPGQRFEILVEDLPPPYATGSASNSAAYKCCPPGQTLIIPDGFRFNAFATGVAHARWLEVAPNGDVFVAQSGPGRIALLRDADGDGVAEVRTVFASGFQRPHGMAVRPGWLYVADIRAVWRIAYEPGQTVAHAAPERVTPTGALGGGSGHWTRSLAFSPDGTRIHVAIGSRGNIGEDPEPRATVRSFDADGGGGRTYAAGLRNPVGMAFYPGTDDLYVVVNERDGLGDDLVPDYLVRLEPGGFYGWPYSYLGANPEPSLAGRRPDLVAEAIVPDVLFQAHSAPLGLVFYDGQQFPADYRGDAFVAFHGSWNAARPTGYKIVRVPFANGRPLGYYENFATGFWFEGTERAVVWGRPAGLAVAADGSLLIADDTAQSVWRISYAP